MRLITLLENESIQSNLLFAHGFSMLIELDHKKILFDIGPNDNYIQNAAQMGIDLKDVDYLIISHGHYDHGFNIDGFLSLNQKAKVYVSKYAFETYVSQQVLKHSIGIKQPMDMSRVVMLEHDFTLAPGVKIINEIVYHKNVLSDRRMKVRIDGQFVEDDFRHELYLLVEENNHNVLISGCSHKGIEEIVKQIELKEAVEMTEVVGGFHFKHYSPEHMSETVYLKDLATRFSKRQKTTFYSCHCTGELALQVLKEKMGSKLQKIQTGCILEF